jgi:hypothetical protein
MTLMIIFFVDDENNVVCINKCEFSKAFIPFRDVKIIISFVDMYNLKCFLSIEHVLRILGTVKEMLDRFDKNLPE